MTRPRPDHRPDYRTGTALGAGIPLGWVLCDLASFLRGGEPALVLRELLGGSLLAVALGALVGGLLSGRRRLQVLIVLALAVGTVVSDQLTVDKWQIPTPLLRSCAAMALAFALADAVLARWSPGALRLGIALGASICTAAAYHEAGPEMVAGAVVLPALLALGLGAVRRSWIRRLGTAAALAAGLALVARATWLAAQPGPGSPAPAGSTAGEPTGNGPGVLLIVMDTVRADHLSAYGYERETTPGLDAYARDEATLFTQARSTSPFTLPSHGSLFTGLYPGEHGASIGGHVSLPLREDVPTLAGRLGAAGYRTGAIFANTLYLNRRQGFDRGFEHFDARLGTTAHSYLALAQMGGRHLRLGHTYRDAERITDLALSWLDERDERDERPFFLALNYLDAHGPIFPPDPFAEAFLDPLRPPTSLSFFERRMIRYDGELLFLDSQLTRLLDGLRARGLHDDTLVVITSDHGHAFGDHGFGDHCWFLYEELLHVPLLVKPPGGRRQAVETAPITGAEVHDLVLARVGLEPDEPPERPGGLIAEWYPWPLTERNLRMQARLQRDLTPDLIAWMRGSVKTIVYSDGTVEVFDLERDPRELNPLALSPEEEQRALEEARAWWREHPADTGPQAAPLDEAQLEALQELGYG